jgi:hypothetical protein
MDRTRRVHLAAAATVKLVNDGEGKGRELVGYKDPGG